MKKIRNILNENTARYSDILSIFSYKILLDYLYINYQNKLFEYYGFNLQFSIERIIVGWIIFFVSAYLLNNRKKTIGDIFVLFIFCISIAPFITYYQFDSTAKLWMVFIQIITLLIMNFVINGRIRVRRIRIGHIKYTSNIFRFCVTISIFVFFVALFLKMGLPSINNILFDNVYDLRSTANFTTIESITLNIMNKIVCPLYMLYAFKEKRYIFFLIALFTQIYSYSVTGFKTTLFIPLIIFLIQVIPSFDIKNVILRAFPALLASVICIYSITSNNMLYAILVNRIFFLPAKIKACYFDFFEHNEYVYFSQNSISKVFDIKSTYTDNIMNMIGSVYFNKPNMWTNTGFMADAYANAGFFGMILVALFVSIIIMIIKSELDKVSLDVKKPLEAIFLMFFVALNDGAAISVLFSGGMLLAVLLIMTIDFRGSI